MSPASFYESRLGEVGLAITSLKNALKWLSFFRLFTLVLSVYLLVRGVKAGGNPVLVTGAILSFFAFIALILLFRIRSNHLRFLRNLQDFNRKQKHFLEGSFDQFNPGTEFQDPEHEYAHDLDVFGKASLFQYINRCSTHSGEKWLARYLKNSPLSPTQWKVYREAIRELESKQLFNQEYIAKGQLIPSEESEQDEILHWIASRSGIYGIWKKILAYSMTLVNLGIIAAGVSDPGLFRLFYFSIPLSWIIYSFHFKDINQYHNLISRKQELITRYNNLNEHYIKQVFQSELLNTMKNELTGLNRNLRKLDRLINLFDSRLNMLVGAILNSLFLFDLIIIQLLESWKSSHGAAIPVLFKHHASIDGLISCGIHVFDHPGYCWPEPVDSGFIMKSTGHPLIPAKVRITNDLVIDRDQKVLLITGANMAGKSTFLRTIGINMILAGTGMKVCASEFKFRRLKLITGMRTTDSLSESESYFFAELKRLKRIIERFENKEELLVLLDEILKGTNSEDKRKGSEALIKRLVNYNGIIMVATHDITLGELENKIPRKVFNYHFDSTIEKDELSFDYKIKPGIAQNMNASFLMKKMQIIHTGKENETN